MSSLTYANPEDLKGAVQGTLLYLSVYVFLLTFQSASKIYLLRKKRRESNEKKDGARVSFRAIKYYNSRDQLALAVDRAVGNFIEFAIVFLPLYWIHAIFGNATQSFSIAAVYSASRLLYLPVWLYLPNRLIIATLPAYLTLLYLWISLVRQFCF